ncbi:MAG: hypothetical protein WC969_08930 [Elusimicrobiota bacterium]
MNTPARRRAVAAAVLAGLGALVLAAGFLFRGRGAAVDDFRAGVDPAAGVHWRSDVQAAGTPLVVPTEPATPAEPSAMPGDSAGVQAPPIAPPTETVASNEEIHNFLEQERTRMGIAKIGVQPEEETEDAREGTVEAVGKDHPMTKKEAMAYMREMTAALVSLNQRRQNQRAPAVPMQGTESPRLISDPDPSGPLVEAAPPASGKTADSVDFVRGKNLSGGKPAAERFDMPMDIQPTAVQARPVRPPLPQVREPRIDFSWKQAWTGAAPGLPPGGAQALEKDKWAKLWSSAGRTDAAPALDFSRQMAVGVFGSPSKGVEIVSIKPQGPNLWVSWRELPDGAPGLTPYQIVVVPSSRLQVTFEKIK